MRSARPEGKQIITAGASATVNAGVGLLFINPASLLASFTLTFPASPADRDELYVVLGGTIASGSPVATLLTIAANAGQTITGTSVTGIVGNAGQAFLYFYDQANTRWYRVV
jgi:hypothetical protein